jgi:8-oxo-dGTP pyrophosphatase MutT (NUDIX family)
MAHIHTDPGQHDLTASGFIVRADQGELKLLLHWHKKLHRWMQFGGHVELHENPWQAATHEILEESGYELSQLDLLQPAIPRMPADIPGTVFHPFPLYVMTGPFPGLDHHHTDISYAFVTDQEPKHKVGDGESSVMRLFSLEEIKALPDTEILGNIRNIAIYVFNECLPNWQRSPAAKWR